MRILSSEKGHSKHLVQPFCLYGGHSFVQFMRNRMFIALAEAQGSRPWAKSSLR